MGFCECGFPLPEWCANCPPKVINCPACGRECLLEPMAEDVAEEIVKQYMKRKRR